VATAATAATAAAVEVEVKGLAATEDVAAAATEDSEAAAEDLAAVPVVVEMESAAPKPL